MHKYKMTSLFIMSLVLIGLGGLGAIFLAIDQYKSDKRLVKQVIESKDSIISTLSLQNKDLETTIGEQKDEIVKLKKKNDTLNTLTKEVLKLSREIDTSSKNIRNISVDVAKITEQTNSISKLMKDEQRQKGDFNIKIPFANNYIFTLGGNYYQVPRTELVTGFIPKIPTGELPLQLKVVGESLFITTRILDKDGEMIVNIEGNKWAINKGKTFSINFDEKGLEVINRSGLIVFQIDSQIDRNQVSVQIRFFSHIGKNAISVQNTGTEIIEILNANYKPKIDELTAASKPIFIHYGEDYLGKRVVK